MRASVVADAVFAALVCEGFAGAVGAARCAAFALGQLLVPRPRPEPGWPAPNFFSPNLSPNFFSPKPLCAALACATSVRWDDCRVRMRPSAGLTALTGTSSAGRPPREFWGDRMQSGRRGRSFHMPWCSSLFCRIVRTFQAFPERSFVLLIRCLSRCPRQALRLPCHRAGRARAPAAPPGSSTRASPVAAPWFQ